VALREVCFWILLHLIVMSHLLVKKCLSRGRRQSCVYIVVLTVVPINRASRELSNSGHIVNIRYLTSALKIQLSAVILQLPTDF
jgi:hypothetical protein